ncbi:PEP/pyruvate-binding domain-containing protein [Oceaniradius stylonematis]|uniref:PEP/pyruvate-binding domain-containing protein n=1 Tax=Oceaniradius stylonematis TaxID=2184161 RepID=UPI00273F3AF2|nr:PEP/pyruvate-binding domain-containing protein [Oceaniradius stylonematis]
MSARPYILWLDDPQSANNPALGGKFASLAESKRTGLPVPPGFGITTHAYRDFMKGAGLEDEARRVRSVCATLGAGQIAAETASLIAAIHSAPLPAQLHDAISAAYDDLERRTGIPDLPVAVRSSGESEDLAGASFAGQYETFLWITGLDGVIENMRRCWAGMYGETVLSYRHQGELVVAKGDFSICVGVQQMVEARAAGVMFTLDPLTGDRSKISIEACWGLGEGVVKGDITPSQFLVDKVVLGILKRKPSRQDEEYRFDRGIGRVGLLPIEEARRDTPCLADEDVVALGRLAKSIEAGRGAPQDIEWAIGADGRIAVLQVRPETVWSSKPARPTAQISSPINHVLMRMSGSSPQRSTR